MQHIGARITKDCNRESSQDKVRFAKISGVSSLFETEQWFNKTNRLNIVSDSECY